MDSGEVDNPGDSTPPLGAHPVSEDRTLEDPALSQFIENMGLQYEAYDVPRIGGRILGLLMVNPNPMTSEEMAELSSGQPQQYLYQPANFDDGGIGGEGGAAWRSL